MFESEATTRGVRVRVRSRYVPDRSDPDNQQWFFAYEVSISNEGTEAVQLLRRHWIITDGDANVQEVEGAGVVGQQPVLAPGESFEYTSGCPLGTPFGTMHGTYRMVAANGESFEACISPFSLGEPHAIN